MRAIHNSGLAIRNFNSSKVLLTGSRVRISCTGCWDIFQAHTSTEVVDIAKAQQDDLTALGYLALNLTCRSLYASLPENIFGSLKKISNIYSPDVKNFILFLTSQAGVNRTIENLMSMFAGYFYTQMETQQQCMDVMGDSLRKRADSDRMFRTLLKICSIMERPELSVDPKWSETGDRYMLKLFRDYVFHPITPDGRPWLDQSHIIYCLNQLDAGTENQVVLTSRNNQNVLLVKYAELKTFLDKSFEELVQESEREPFTASYTYTFSH